MIPLCLFSLLTAAPAPQPRADNIECSLNGEYIGGIDRKYSLVISGPKQRTWRYQFAEIPGAPFDYSGTYEIKDDLAIFTGSLKGTKDEVRFGINFGFPGNKVHFTGFFPDSERTLRYHRTWHRKVDGKWQQREEITLTIPRDVPVGKKWNVPITGERILWDEGGRATRIKIAETVPFALREGGSEFEPTSTNFLTTLFYLLRPVANKGRLDAVLLHPEGGTGGWLHGFQPGLAEIVRVP